MSSGMKLYYTPTSCSAASFIVCHYAGLNFEPEEINLSDHKLVRSGQDFYSINHKGNVPTIILPGGQQLNENCSVLLYLADEARKLGKVTNLAPPEGTIDRYLFINLLSFLATEVHKGGYYPLFGANMLEKPSLKKTLNNKLQLLNEHLNNRSLFLFGETFTSADAYAYVLLTWNEQLNITLDEFPNLKNYFNRCKELDFVKTAHMKMNDLHNLNTGKHQGAGDTGSSSGRK